MIRCFLYLKLFLTDLNLYYWVFFLTFKCPRGYSGDPYTNCRLDPCSTGPCADNAICENSGNAAVCKCPPAHTGDPYINCR